ncbi:MAG TPA: nuclear transport factor 2 family protein [Rhodocyclaceae bacterium]|nr:nuclear transport factor 2 family protein [Rhodocyclaceae bacterium]
MKSNFQIISDHYAASARGDVAAMMADLSPDIRWTEMAGFPCAGTWIGASQIIEKVFQVLAEAWEDYRFTLERLVDGGEVIVGIGAYSGTFRRTGKPFQARVAHVWRLADGKVISFEQFTDTLLVAQAMS